MRYARTFGSRRFWLLLAVSSGGLALFVSQLEFAAMGESFAQADLGLVAVAAATYMAAHAVRSVRWRVLLSHIHDCGRWRPFHALSIAMLTNNVLPVKAGLAARVHLVSSKTPISHAAVGSSLIVEALFDGVILLGLVLLALAALPLHGGIQAAATALAVSMGAVALIVALVLTGCGPTKRLSRLSTKIPGRLGRVLRETGSALRDGLGAVRRPSLAASALSTSLMYWLLLGTTYALLGVALRLPLDLLDYVAVLAIVQLAIGAPSAGAGVGTFQVVMIQTMASLGVASGAAGAYVVALHAMIVVPVSLPGAGPALGRSLPFRAPRRRAHRGAPAHPHQRPPRRAAPAPHPAQLGRRPGAATHPHAPPPAPPHGLPQCRRRGRLLETLARSLGGTRPAAHLPLRAVTTAAGAA